MFNYIIRRSAYSVLIIIGVMIVTFVLFKIAAGDPVAAVLGKNPTPREVEDLRTELGADRPLFWGSWLKTEAYRSARFESRKDIPGLKIEGDAEFRNGCLKLSNGKITISRNFDPESRIKGVISFKGKFILDDKVYSSAKGGSTEIYPESEKIVIETGPEETEFHDIEFFKKQNSPWNSQFFASMTELVSIKPQFPYISFFNFGRALTTREPISQILRRGILPSLFLMLPIFFGELVLGIILALFATAFKGSWTDRIIVLLSVAGMSISYLVFIIFGQWYLGYYFNLFPVWGYGDIRHLILPVAIGIASGLGGGVRFYRTVFINELNREYLRTAKAKGCRSISIYSRHLLRNAAVPIITRATTILPFLFTGSLLLESFFGIPGLGYAGINALNNADIQMLKALVILGAVLFVFINLVADITYAWADPRVRVNSKQ